LQLGEVPAGVTVLPEQVVPLRVKPDGQVYTGVAATLVVVAQVLLVLFSVAPLGQL
jgi:hypothetical protein